MIQSPHVYHVQSLIYVAGRVCSHQNGIQGLNRGECRAVK